MCFSNRKAKNEEIEEVEEFNFLGVVKFDKHIKSFQKW